MKLEFTAAKDDGEVCKDEDGMLEGYVYLHVNVIVDGEREGSLSGWYRPEHAAGIMQKLGVA